MIFSKTQPDTLIVWGKYDASFQVAEAEAHKRDVSTAYVHMVDAGHFALDTDGDEIADLIRAFLPRSAHA